jgi:hypothetical protein
MQACLTIPIGVEKLIVLIDEDLDEREMASSTCNVNRITGLRIAIQRGETSTNQFEKALDCAIMCNKSHGVWITRKRAISKQLADVLPSIMSKNERKCIHQFEHSKRIFAV